MTSNYRKTKPDWYRESLNPMGPSRNVNKENYRVRSPWDQESGEVVDEFDRQLNAVDNNLVRPWDEGSYDLEQLEKEKERAKSYKFHSMFEVPELSDKKKKQLAQYEYNPPFNCGFNAIQEEKKSAKKLNPEVKNPKTRAPWKYGELPIESAHKKQFQQPSTILWDVPRGDREEAPLESSGDPVLDLLREQLKKHGALGISGLARKFKIMDDDGSGTLNFEEFRKGMKETGVTNLSDKALRHLFLYFDRDDSGSISYDEFLVGIRGVMNERRRNLVKMAFKVLDSDGSGVIDINDIKGVYNAKFHPDVIAEKRTEEEVLLDFLQSFERPINPNSKTRNPHGSRDGMVTLDEFIEYYQNVSSSIDEDDYFELMIRNAWHISGGKGQYENTTNRRILVTDIHGNQTIQELKDDIRMKKDDAKEMLENLKRQGVDNIAFINTTDKLNMKNTIQNPNIIEVRTKYAASDLPNGGSGGDDGDVGAVPVPLNAYFNQTMTYGLPKNLNNAPTNRSRPATSGGGSGRLQLDTNSINRSSNQNNLTGASPMPLNAYRANPTGNKGGNDIGNSRNSLNNTNATTMNVNMMRGNGNIGYNSNSRPQSARVGSGGLNRTFLY